MDNIILPAKMPLNDLSWKGVQAVIKAGKAKEYLKHGDTKTIVLNGRVGKANFNNAPIDVFVLGIDHNADLEGRNRVHFGIGMKDGNLTGLCHALYHLNDGFCMNLGPSADPSIEPDNDGGWEKSHMRTPILGADKSPASPAEGTLLAALPRALREVMVPTFKYTVNNANADVSFYDPLYLTATRDSLWLLSEYEIFGEDACVSSCYEDDKQKQYDYFKMKPNAADRRIMAYNNMKKGPHGAVIAHCRSLTFGDTH